MPRRRPLIAALVATIAVLAMLWRAWQPDALATLDAMLARGELHAVVRQGLLPAGDPQRAAALVRVAVAQLARGEDLAADASASTAIGLGLRGEDLAIARLVQRECAARAGDDVAAAQLTPLIAPGTPAAGAAQVLAGTRAAQAGDTAAAAPLLATVQTAGFAAAAQRALALVLAATGDDAGARTALDAATRASGTPLAILAPLVPPATYAPDTLRAALADPDRPLAVARVLLAADRPALAGAVLGGRDDAPALALRALALLRTGAPAAAADLLADAATVDLLMLRAGTQLAAGDLRGAATTVGMVQQLAPGDPAAARAAGDLAAAQSDYLAAAAHYTRARELAPPAARADYALALAQYYGETGVELCSAGMAAATRAVDLAPQRASAHSVLAAARFGCADARGARTAADAALALDTADAAAHFWRGRALIALGDRAGGTAALVRAADLDAAGAWRARAEAQLAVLEE